MASTILICDDNQPTRRMVTRRTVLATIAVQAHDDVGDRRPGSAVELLLDDLDGSAARGNPAPAETVRHRQQ